MLYFNYNLYVVDSNLKKNDVYNYLRQELPPLLDNMLLPQESKDGSGEKAIVHPTAIQLGLDGLFYVADVVNQCIIVLNSVGKYVRRFGTKGVENGSFEYPGGLAFNKNGDVYVADSSNGRIQGFDHYGRFLTKIDGSQGKSGHLALP